MHEMSTTETHIGKCHCGGVSFEVRLDHGLEELRRCNCSLCRRKGAVMATVPAEKLRIIEGHDLLTLYKWNSMTAEHYFCRVCGIYTHHRRRSNPAQYGFNVACLDGVDPYKLDIGVGDGASQTLV